MKNERHAREVRLADLRERRQLLPHPPLAAAHPLQLRARLELHAHLWHLSRAGGGATPVRVDGRVDAQAAEQEAAPVVVASESPRFLGVSDNRVCFLSST